MLDFHEKRKLKAWLYSKPAIAVILVAAALLSLSVFDRFRAERDMAGKRSDMEQELRELEGKAAALEAEVSRLKSERGIEAEIRDRFEVAKSGEQVVVVLGAEEAASSTRATTSTPGFFERLRAFFVQ